MRQHVEYANSVWSHIRKAILQLLKKLKKRATKLIISLKHLPYMERLKVLKLPALQYRRLSEDMIEVFKLVHNYYDLQATVMTNFNTS